MGDVRITGWNADAVTRRAMDEFAKRMRRAVIVPADEAKRLVSRAQPTRRTASGRRIGLDPSKPGEPPKIVTGILRANIGTEVRIDYGARTVDGFIGVKKGPADPYGRRLELGFVGRDALGRYVNQAPRPYLIPAVLFTADRIAERLGAR